MILVFDGFCMSTYANGALNGDTSRRNIFFVLRNGLVLAI